MIKVDTFKVLPFAHCRKQRRWCGRCPVDKNIHSAFDMSDRVIGAHCFGKPVRIEFHKDFSFTMSGSKFRN